MTVPTGKNIKNKKINKKWYELRELEKTKEENVYWIIQIMSFSKL